MTSSNQVLRTVLAKVVCFSLTLSSVPQVVAQTQPLDSIVAVVNDAVITESELNAQLRLVEQQLKQQSVQAPPTDVLRRQVLERMVLTQLQLEMAASRGIQVDDETLNEALRNIAARNNLTLSQFRDVLERDHFDFADFREDLRNQIVIHRLRERMIDSRVTVTDREVSDFLARQGAGAPQDKEYHLAHILIAVPEAASPEQIQTARREAEKVLADLRAGADFSETAIAVSDGQQALEGGDLGWRRSGELPTIFANVVGSMQPGQVSNVIRSPSGFHIVKLVDDRSQKGRAVTQVRIRHILLQADDEASERQARIRLMQLIDRIEAGEDFGTLARAHSSDTSSAPAGGELGWMDPNRLPPPFPEVLSNMAPGDVSKPFKTAYGLHIVQVEDRRQGVESEADDRMRAQELLRARKIDEETEAWLRRVRDEAYVEYHLDRL